MQKQIQKVRFEIVITGEIGKDLFLFFVFEMNLSVLKLGKISHFIKSLTFCFLFCFVFCLEKFIIGEMISHFPIAIKILTHHRGFSF